MKKKKRTKEEMLEKYHEARKLVAQGAGIETACNQTGLGVGSYYYYNRKPKQRRSKITVMNLPEVKADQGKLFMVYGSPSMLADFAKGLA